MIVKILETILKIPAMVEFILGAIVYLLIANAAAKAVSGAANEAVCESPGLGSWLLCFYYTNPLVAFISMVATVICLGLLFRAKFLS